ncbi:hypothetical protein BS47DRAFT_1031859 [Hydnum rufescens UP504]|uniref:Uncharacterized protein n=1 Tax=Hydnum rufescens UP504 TaxID=1448309 RepID=A0A9P6AVL0_9AGAM|nr:hypothetical protein BS47DRAFT_1031859 [Hydnum rufescens UP504]
MAKVSIFANNAAIAIPISIGVGLVFFVLLWAIFLRVVRWCCCGRRHDGRMKPPASATRMGSFDGLDPVDVVNIMQVKPEIMRTACPTRIPLALSARGCHDSRPSRVGCARRASAPNEWNIAICSDNLIV